jgi:hypothetical protein
MSSIRALPAFTLLLIAFAACGPRKDPAPNDESSPSASGNQSGTPGPDGGAADPGPDRCAGAPIWSDGWDENGGLRVPVGTSVAGSSGGVLTLRSDAGDIVRQEFTSSREQIQCSQGTSCEPCDLLLSQGTLDGYAGTPVTGDTCVNDPNCVSAGDVLTLEGTGMRHVLLKNMVVKNMHVEHGDSVQRSLLKHVGAFSYGGWFVIQDSEIRNTDSSALYFSPLASTYSPCGANPGPGGILLQNVQTRPDANFLAECLKRNWTACTTSLFITGRLETGTAEVPAIWLVNVDSALPISLIFDDETTRYAAAGLGKVVVVGEKQPALSFPGAQPRLGVFKYATLEQAIEVHGEPPFARLSGSGWSSPQVPVCRP